jgi:hypothetical protein
MAANIDDATDADVTTNGYIQFSSGLTITSNGGNITLGGSDATATSYALGTSAYPYEGIRVDGTLNINSGGGNVIMRGKSYAISTASGSWGLGFWNLTTGNINSGTGTILLDGLSQSSNGTHNAGIYTYGALTITSLNTTADAIKLIGKGTASGNEAWAIEAESALTILATGEGGGITISTSQQNTASNLDIVLRGETNILAKSGPINLLGGQSGGIANGALWVGTTVNIGSKASSPVTSSSSNITIQYDKHTFYAYPNLATSGTLTWKPVSTSFGADVQTSWFNWNQNNQTMSGLTIGKLGNTANVSHQSAAAISAAGPISIFGGIVKAEQNLTASLSGAAILLQASEYIDVAANRTIQTNNGNITLRSNSAGIAVVLPNATTGAITLNDGSSLLSTGGNITLGGNFDGTQGSGLYAASARTGGSPGILISNANLNAAGGNINIYGRCFTSYDDGIRLQANISTTGAGSIGVYGDAFGGLTSATNNVFFGGITFINNSSTIETENGDINIEAMLTNTQSNGTYALNFYRTAYSSGTDTRDIQLISKTGDIQITGDRGTTSAGGMGSSSWGNIYVGSPLSAAWTSSGDVKFSFSSFVGAGLKGIKTKTTGGVTYEPTAASFVNAETFPYNANYIVAESASSLTIGKPGNTADITCNATQTVSGPISIYGGTISINENLNTSAGAALGTVLLKGSGDVTLAADKSITTSGAPVILWANSDNQTTNGSVALRNGSSIVTGSSSVAGGHIWIGGGSDGTTWNGLAVGNGYAVPGTSFTPSNGGGVYQPSGIYLERNSISSFGGNIKIAGDGTASGVGIITYGNTVAINAGSGRIDIDGQVTSAATGNRGGILFGLHENQIFSTVTIASSATTGDAITINGVGRGTDDAIGLSGTLNITSSGGGNIVMNGNALGTGRSIVAGNYYHGILNIFANSGNISLNGNTKAVQVATAFINGLTSGPSKINIGQGGSVTSSTSDVFITADNIALAAGGIAINTSGKVTVEPSSASFASAVTFPITNLSITNTITGLTIGKPTNSANVTVASPTTIAGPISIYGGTIALNENITSSNGSTITLFANTLNFASGKTVTSNNGQLIVAPQNTASTVGLAGATGTLQLPVSYFSTNFTNGFSNIQIGSNSQTGGISSNAFTLNDHMTFLTTGQLTLGGKPVLGSNNVTLGTGITNINVGSPANYFQTNGSGKVMRNITNGTTLDFPIGNSAYNPLSIKNNTGLSDVFSAKIKDTLYFNGSSGTSVTTPAVNRIWDISKTTNNISSGVDFVFNWNAGELINATTLVDPKMNHFTGTVWEVPSVASTVVGSNSLTVTGYTGNFSPFAISDGASPLPVEMLSFSEECLENIVKLVWQTASEHNSSYFEIERSELGNDWEQIGTVSASGNSSSLQQYTFADITPSRLLRYYRLKQVDLDGHFEYFGPLAVNCSVEGSELSIFPNPTTTSFTILIDHTKKEIGKIKTIDSSGKVIWSQEIELMNGVTMLPVSSINLDKGIYFIHLSTGDVTKTSKLVVN